jgi:hypothetical protein
MKLDFYVTRRGIDPAAQTCMTALRDLMHLDVAGVERGALWCFDLPDQAPLTTSRERLRQAACRAGRYVNTNRDVAAWLEGPRPYPTAAPATGHAVDIWVRDGDGADAAALGWFRAQALPELRGVRRGILWRLWLPARAPAAARALALDIAATRNRHHGLLANPHSQSATILDVVPGPEAAKEPV